MAEEGKPAWGDPPRVVTLDMLWHSMEKMQNLILNSIQETKKLATTVDQLSKSMEKLKQDLKDQEKHSQEETVKIKENVSAVIKDSVNMRHVATEGQNFPLPHCRRAQNVPSESCALHPTSQVPLPGGIILVLLILIAVVASVAAVRAKKHQPDSNLLAVEVEEHWKGGGTTRNLQEIIVGRCYDYVRAASPWIGEKNCAHIWEEFQNVFVYKNPCSVMKEDYQRLMDLTSHPIPCNKSMFWSKTNDLVHQYTKASPDFVTLENTMLGYLADGLTWCGKLSSPGINHQSCPSWRECEDNPVSSFWKIASESFAKASCGVVQVMLNGSLSGVSISKNSLFRSVEVPHFNPNKISEVRVWVIDDVGGPDSESCDSQSVMELENELKERNFKYSCFDNYRPVRLLQCVRNPDHAECKFCS
ncbi:ADP-ribosyl cyclase/cyclic ADP-ribose hydrolase 1 [Microcaecilia unicolor]|uniref:ADP-ribosyl cyclase/cyclic ADP-ribose hydrolase 1 n=1 Tax=Microcaecilia unicolor TaxID=1415580 RepID=A0A6P7X6G4_9AMPH|nr:ADP-ribosyl cyclase/cyclic ADP-ribose hydrolase 1-like [Microcaecilia unicolor]